MGASSILKTIILRLIYDSIEEQIVPQLKNLWQEDSKKDDY